MNLGYHSPLPPAPTGVADYARDLLQALQTVAATQRGTVSIAPRTADVHLCQLGNNLLHAPIQRVLEGPDWPGRKVVLLHDANLHHYYLGARNREGYVREFCHQYGAWHRGFAEQLWQERARSASDPRYFRYSMLASVVRAADLVLVHNPEARRRVLAQVPEARVACVPHYFRNPYSIEGWRVEELRASLGLNGTTTLFGVFGHLRESKRLLPILRAFARARQRNPRIALLIAGQPVSQQFATTLHLFANAPGVLRCGHLPEPDFWRMAASVDACINLRYPSCGESSGIAIRLMGLGKPVLLTVSNSDSEAEFPAGTYLPVDAGEAEEAMLEEYMLLLAGDCRIQQRIGHAAAAHVLTHHDLSHIAEVIWRLCGQTHH